MAQTLSQLELHANESPNSIEIQQALAEAYAKQGRWKEAANVYRRLSALYPDTAALFINRIQLGATALMVSSTLTLVAVLIQPALTNENQAQVLGSFSYLVAQILFMPALALYSCSSISIYKLLSYTRDHRPAFWGMVFSVIGAGLSMPALGIRTFVYPILGRMALSGQTDALVVYSSLNEQPLRFFLGMGAYLIVAGIAVFAWAVWRNRGLSLFAIIFFLAGWVGWIATRNPVIFGIVIAFSGYWLGVSLRRRASIQFNPNMDRTLRS